MVSKIRRLAVHRGAPGELDRVFLWKREVYKEWFEYAKLAGNTPFGDLSKFKTFFDWFLIPNNACDLFCEPYLEDAVKMAEGRLPANHIRVDINLQAEPDKLIHLFHRFIILQPAAPPLTWQTSQALYKPSVSPKHIKVDSLKLMRQVYTLMKHGLKRWQISEKMGWIDEDIIERRKKEGLREEDVADLYEAANRKVSRHRATVEKILKNVAKGQFP